MSKRKGTINASISITPELKRRADKRVAELRAKAGPGFSISFSSYLSMLIEADLEKPFGGEDEREDQRATGKNNLQPRRFPGE